MTTRRKVLLGTGTVLLAATGLGFGFGNMGSMEDYNKAMADLRAPAQQTPNVLDLIRLATLAANSHNTQPWAFKMSKTAVEILPDLTRQLTAVDPDNHHLFASLGCAAANLALAGQASGKSGDLIFNPANDGSLVFTFRDALPNPTPLSQAITKRQSTRAEYDGRPVNANDLKLLADAAALPGVATVLITERSGIDKIRDLVIAANTVQMNDTAFVKELKAWIRYNPRSALLAADGLFSACTGNPTLPDWLGPVLFSMAFQAKSENDKYAKQINSSAGIAVFASEKDDPEHWTLAGRASQLFALQATAIGIQHAFINQPVEVSSFRPELAKLIGLPDRRPDLVMRFGYGPDMPYSPRRPLAKLMA